MEKSKKIIVIVVSVIIIVSILILFLFGLNICRKRKYEEENKKENIIQSEIIEEVVDKYHTIDSIDMEYTIENALENNDFVIDKENKIHNENLLKDFISEISNSGDVSGDMSLRISSETTDSLLSVLEIQSSGDEILVIQNNVQLSGDIIQNKYLKSEGYTVRNEIVTLVDGTKLKSYYLTKSASGEKIDLFAYIVEDFESEIQSSGDLTESSGDLIENSGDLIE